jgi:hypothetical protein
MNGEEIMPGIHFPTYLSLVPTTELGSVIRVALNLSRNHREQVENRL